MIVIGIGGKAGSGKDTVASTLVEVLDALGYKATTYSLAQPIKHIANYVFGLTDAEMNTQEGKKMVSRHGYGKTNREILQLIGTEGFRDIFHDNIWVDFAHRWINNDIPSEYDVVLIPDIRFNNEAEWVKSIGALIKVERGDLKEIAESSHASEAGFTSEPDFVLHNNGTLEEFKNLVAEKLVMEIVSKLTKNNI